MVQVSATTADNKKRRDSCHDFAPQSLESNRKHIQYAGFHETMLKTYRGELEPLHEYFRTFLREDHAEEIAAFFKRRLRRDRHLITAPPSPEREAEDRIIGLALCKLKYLRKQLGHRLPDGEYQRQIDQAWDDLAENDELFNADHALINNKRILKVVQRGKKPTVADNKTRRRSQYVHHAQSRESVHSIQYAGFRKIMRQAYAGKLEALHEYLRAFLHEDHADEIMEWAKPRLRRDLFQNVLSEEAEDLIIGLVKNSLKDVRQRLGGHRLPDGEYQRLIDQSRTELVKDGVLDAADLKEIKNERILKVLRRAAKV
jgi:hypothetical protein